MTAALVATLKRQSPTAFEQLIAQHGPMLFRVALRLMDRPEEAEEVLQETLLTVYEKIHTFGERSALTTWLYRITVDTALMRLRAKARMPEDTGGDLRGSDVTEQGQHAREVVDWALPPEKRSCCVGKRLQRCSKRLRTYRRCIGRCTFWLRSRDCPIRRSRASSR